MGIFNELVPDPRISHYNLVMKSCLQDRTLVTHVQFHLQLYRHTFILLWIESHRFNLCPNIQSRLWKWHIIQISLKIWSVLLELIHDQNVFNIESKKKKHFRSYHRLTHSCPLLVVGLLFLLVSVSNSIRSSDHHFVIGHMSKSPL